MTRAASRSVGGGGRSTCQEDKSPELSSQSSRPPRSLLRGDVDLKNLRIIRAVSGRRSLGDGAPLKTKKYAIRGSSGRSQCPVPCNQPATLDHFTCGGPAPRTLFVLSHSSAHTRKLVSCPSHSQPHPAGPYKKPPDSSPVAPSFVGSEAPPWSGSIPFWDSPSIDLLIACLLPRILSALRSNPCRELGKWRPWRSYGVWTTHANC